MDKPDLLTAAELADRLQVRPSTIRRWVAEGRIPVVRFSPKVQRFNLTAVVQAIEHGQKPQGVADVER